MIFDQARGCVGVQMLNNGTIADVDLFTLDHRRDRYDDRKVLGLAFEIVGHRDDRPVLVTYENDL